MASVGRKVVPAGCPASADRCNSRPVSGLCHIATSAAGHGDRRRSSGTVSGAAIAQYCVTCGNGLVATAAICPRCGTPVPGAKPVQVGAKSRSTAVLLAVFLSFWSFLYTYSISAWKFWLGLGLSVLPLIIVYIMAAANGSPGIAVASYLISLGVWIWAIVDRSTTSL